MTENYLTDSKKLSRGIGDYMENLTLEEMNIEIERFIEIYWGTAIGDSVYKMRINTVDNDYDGIKDIYDYIKEQEK